MSDSGKTIERSGTVLDDEYLMNLRRITFDQLAVYEHKLGMSPTTAERLLWLRERGPGDHIIAKQVRHIKECKR